MREIENITRESIREVEVELSDYCKEALFDHSFWLAFQIRIKEEVTYVRSLETSSGTEYSGFPAAANTRIATNPNISEVEPKGYFPLREFCLSPSQAAHVAFWPSRELSFQLSFRSSIFSLQL